MKTDKPVLIIASHLGAGKTAIVEAVSLMRHHHPDLIVVDSSDEAKQIEVVLEAEKERGILINPIKQFELSAMDFKNYHELQPQIKITHKGEQIKSARNIRREKDRKQKKYR